MQLALSLLLLVSNVGAVRHASAQEKDDPKSKLSKSVSTWDGLIRPKPDIKEDGLIHDNKDNPTAGRFPSPMERAYLDLYQKEGPQLEEMHKRYKRIEEAISKAHDEGDLSRARRQFAGLKEDTMDLLVDSLKDPIKNMSPDERAKVFPGLPQEFLDNVDKALVAEERTGLYGERPQPEEMPSRRIESVQNDDINWNFQGTPRQPVRVPEPFTPSWRREAPSGSESAEEPLSVPVGNLPDIGPLKDNDKAFADYMANVARCRPEVMETIFKVAKRYGYTLNETMGALGIIRTESSFRPNAYAWNPKGGARGLMQLIPGTCGSMARKLGLPDCEPKEKAYDVEYNLLLGMAYFKQNLDRFGSVEYAAAAHNAGPGNVSRYASIPETATYVPRVLAGYKYFYDAASAYLGQIASAK